MGLKNRIHEGTVLPEIMQEKRLYWMLYWLDFGIINPLQLAFGL
jgi:hypothetical protein